MMNDLSDMAVIRSPHESDYLPTEAWGSPQPLQDVLEDQSEVAAAADHCRPALAEAEPVTPSPSKRRISKKTVKHNQFNSRREMPTRMHCGIDR